MAPDDEFAPALRYWTGSRAHNIRLYREYGPPPERAESESEIYRDLGLNFIPPELREDQGEFEAARGGTLPSLVEMKDIRGDLHIHGLTVGGADLLEEYAATAMRMGYEYIAITDHLRSPFTPYGLDEAGIRSRMREIEHLNRRLEGLTLLSGIEANINKDGSIDLPASMSRDLDLVIASVHSDFSMARDEMTLRIVRAVEENEIHVLGHPTGRIIGKRAMVHLDLMRIADVSRERNVLLELNAHPARLDLNGEGCRRAKAAGTLFALGSDAHRPEAMGNLLHGVAQVRRGWLEKRDLVVTMPLSLLLARLNR
ncbi:MAG: PHP domain-containing protein [Methanomicrobiales archaeon]|nr:PHP domain-containing protein [Methanomicrobiales archaeon]